MLVYDSSSDTWIDDGSPAINAEITQQPGTVAVNSGEFDHASRLADKLFGAFELVLDNATYNQRIIAARDASNIQLASQPTIQQRLNSYGVPSAVIGFIVFILIGVLGFVFLRK